MCEGCINVSLCMRLANNTAVWRHSSGVLSIKDITTAIIIFMVISFSLTICS